MLSLVAFDVCLLMMRQVSPSSVAKQRIISTELHPDLVQAFICHHTIFYILFMSQLMKEN
jgi:hypothetical protein